MRNKGSGSKSCSVATQRCGVSTNPDVVSAILRCHRVGQRRAHSKDGVSSLIDPALVPAPSCALELMSPVLLPPTVIIAGRVRSANAPHPQPISSKLFPGASRSLVPILRQMPRGSARRQDRPDAGSGRAPRHRPAGKPFRPYRSARPPIRDSPAVEPATGCPGLAHKPFDYTGSVGLR